MSDALDLSSPCPLAPALAASIRDARQELTRRWLERISARVALAPNRVFPTDDLLDHVPLLIDGIADYLEHPAHEVAADAPAIGKAMELGALRHRQGFDPYQILKEFELLGGILFAHLISAVRTMTEPCGKDELLACGHRLFRAVSIIQEASVAHYLQHMRGRIAEREEQLRSFNRALTHEFKNQIGAVLGAGDLLDLDDLSATERSRLVEVVRRNAAAMRGTLDNLMELSRTDTDARQQRRIPLQQAIAEAIRGMRDMAAAARVDVRLLSLPSIEVPAAAVELATRNYLSNAIKYANPDAADRWVEVRGHARHSRGHDAEVVVEIWDNGLGVPEEKRGRLFEPGFRAHLETVTDVEGTGLGLSIVKDAIEAVGGRVSVGFPASGGSCFGFALPARRSGEGTASGDASDAAPSGAQGHHATRGRG